MKKYLIIIAILLLASIYSVKAESYSFDSDLSLGSQGSDVVNLQTWLISNGFDIPAVSRGLASKGYFGSQTRDAVAAYQRSNSLPAYGYFGPMTRKLFNGKSSIENSSFRVISPNGGEVWQRGTVQNIVWSGSQGLMGQTGDIRLQFQVPACAELNQPIRCMIAVRAPLLIARNINLQSGSYSWTVGNGTDLSGTNPETVSDGKYKIQICMTNSGNCYGSKDYFSVVSNTNPSNSPVINGLDAPSSLTTNQMGTWTVKATDSQNGQLSYSVVWGDENANIGLGYPSVASSPAFTQSATFTHSYSSPGIYKPTFTVRNSSGISVSTSATVQVTGTNSAGPLRITFPNGGETLQKGTSVNITWTSPFYFRATNADLNLVPVQPVCPSGMMCAQYMLAPYKIVSGISINQNSYNWNVGNVLSTIMMNSNYMTAPDGQYTLQICETGTSNCDSSDSYVTIASSYVNNIQFVCPVDYICTPNR